MKRSFLKLFALALSVCLLAGTMAVQVFAQEEVLPLNDAIKDSGNWSINQPDTPAVLMGKVDMTLPNTVVGYTGRNFKNEILEFNVKMTFDPNDGWTYISLKNEKSDIAIWDSKHAYCVFFKGSGTISLEKWAPGQQVLAAVENKLMLDGNNHKMQFGAVDTAEGVKLILKIDDQEIFNYVDKEAPLTGEGQLSAMTYLGSTMTLSAVESTTPVEEEEPAAPVEEEEPAANSGDTQATETPVDNSEKATEASANTDSESTDADNNVKPIEETREENPKTGDAAAAAYVVMAGVGAFGAFQLKKRVK